MSDISTSDYKIPGTLKFWCQKVLPLVYDDSLSYYELLCKVVDYINNLIHDNSATIDNMDALLNAFNQLQDYVNESFDELNVYNEVSEKIDRMAEDGELLEILEPVTDELTQYVRDQATAQQEYNAQTRAQTNSAILQQNAYNEQTRDMVSAMVGHPFTASTPGEMSDTTKIYVYTGETTSSYTYGHWYYYNGSAWIDGGEYNSPAIQIDSSLNSPGDAADAGAVGVRLRQFAPRQEWTYNYRLNPSTGVAESYTGQSTEHAITDFIDCSDRDDILGFDYTSGLGGVTTCAVFIYDENGTYLGYIFNSALYGYVSPSGTMSPLSSAPTFQKIRFDVNITTYTAEQFPFLYPDIMTVRRIGTDKSLKAINVPADAKAVGVEITHLKQDISESLPHAKIIEFQNKTFSMLTGKITTDNPARLISELLDIQEGDTFSMDSGYQYEVFRFDRQGTYLANPIAWASGDTQFTATSVYGNYLHRIYVRKNDSVSAITADEIGITFDIASIDDTYFNVEDKVDNKYGGLLALKKEWKTAEQKAGTVTTGKFLKISGSETSSSTWNYRTLNVTPGEQYAVSAYAGIDARLWLILSASDTVLLFSADNSSVSLKTDTITIPDGGAKLIVNTEVQNTAEINAILIEKIGTLSKIDERSVPANLLAGKVLCCVGDSITYGADMDTDGITNVSNVIMYQCNNSGVFSEVTSRFRKTWGYQIAERNNMIFYNGGVSGSTMQGENGVNGFSLANGRYTKLPDTIDYLVIWFGWNDTAYGTLGTIADDTNATFYGGYNVVIPYLQNKYPYAKIMLVVPYGTDENHRNAVRQLGNKWGLAVWDNYQGGTPLYYGKETSVGAKASVVTANQAKFQANGAHPNFKGHTQLADMIEAFLKTI